MGGRSIGTVSPTELVEARLQLHYAAQVASGFPRTRLPRRNDDSHTNLAWVSTHGALAGRDVDGLSAGVAVAGLRLIVLDRTGSLEDAVALAGMTVEEAYRWLGARTGVDRFVPLHYELPSHRLAQGARFDAPDVATFAELYAWFELAARLLEQVRDQEPTASEVRCWPHHFDIATLIGRGEGSSIGVGLSPGDGSYREPYWYVSPWPKPERVKLPALEAGGEWHTEGFTAAVMTGSEAVASADPESRSQNFLDAAIAACREALEQADE